MKTIKKKTCNRQHHVYQDNSNYDHVSDRHNTQKKQRHVENKPSGGNNNSDDKSPQNKDIKHPKIPSSNK